MNEAHVFQHKYTGVQIFVYQCKNELTATLQFMSIVTDHRDWIYIGKKTATEI